MTVSAPAASALTRSPDVLTPPSAMTGRARPVSAMPATLSMMAVNWGTPKPVTTRVVQMDPGPMPTLMASAPASANSRAPSRDATLPATICASGKARRRLTTMSMQWSAWPWAMSSTSTSTPASRSASARAMSSGLTPMAAPTRKRPRGSTTAWGYCCALMTS